MPVLFWTLSSHPAFGQFERAPEPISDAVPTERAQIEPPKLEHFEAAAYPAQARSAGLTANVVLRLTIDEMGNVTQAEVVEAAGHGFDEAARAAALRFTFLPATRDGAAVKAKILYRYSFTLEPASGTNAPDRAPPRPPSVGELSLVLRVAGTDLPLAGAKVTLLTSKGARLQKQSDGQGQLVLAGMAPGSYRIQVSSPGFVDLNATETVVAGEATDAVYRLAPAADEDGIEVTVQATRPAREVTRRTIEQREMERIPGTSGDALRSIESMPGVARPPAFAGILVVRGSYPEDTQVYVDGSLIPLVYHFGGLRSVLPTELLERIDFYPGNYGAKYGRGMGGIVDVGLKSPETRCKDERGGFTAKRGCFSGIAQVDLIEGRVLLQGPLPIKGYSFALAGRRSWLDAWMGPVLNHYEVSVRSLPVYYDYQFILERKVSADARTSLRFFGSDDRFAAVVDPLAQEPAFGGALRFGTAFMQAQLLHEHQLNSKVKLSTLATVGKTTVSFGVGSFMLDMLSHPIHWREELAIKLASGVKLNAGLDFQIYPYEITARTPSPPSPGQPTAGPFSSQPILEMSEAVTGLNQGFYVDAELQPTKRLRAVPGFRVDYTRETGRTDLSPRLNARYDLVPGATEPSAGSRRRTTLKGGVGYYHQAPQSQQSNAVYGTTGLRSNRALHYALGLEQELTRQLDLSVEGFYKDFDRLVAAGTPADLVRYTNNGFGKSYGLETLLRYKPDKRFFGWVAYTLSRSIRQDYRGDEPYLIPYDQTHNLTLLGSYRLGNGWECGLRFRVISGSLVTPVRENTSVPSIYAADAGTSVPLQAEPFSHRLPLFHQVDLRLDKRWQTKHYRISTYLDVYNVYNNPAVEALAYDFNFAHRMSLRGIPILPSVGVRGEF